MQFRWGGIPRWRGGGVAGLIAAVVVASFLGACGNGPTELSPEESLVNGLAVVEPSDPGIAAIAVHGEGDMVAMLRDPGDGRIRGVHYESPDGERFTAFLDAEGRPRLAVTQGFVLVYENWTPDRVDIAVIHPDGEVTVERDVEVDASELFSPASQRGTTLSGPASVIGSGPSLGDVLLVGVLGLKTAACGAAVIKTAGIAAPIAAPCLKLVIARLLASSLIDDERIRLSVEGIVWNAGALGCAFEMDLSECIILILDIAVTSVGMAEDVIEQWEEARERAGERLRSPWIYASSGVSGLFGPTRAPSDLYIVEVSEIGRDDFRGRLRTIDGDEPVITDIAVAPSGDIFAVSWEVLYLLDRETAILQQVGGILHDLVVGLEFHEDGTLYAATGRGELLTIDPSTGAGTLVGEFGDGWESSGDLAFGPDGRMYGTVRNGGSSDVLVTVDLATGRAAPVSPENNLGFRSVFGLSFVEQELYGLTTIRSGEGTLIRIDLSSGTAIEVRALEFQATGAGAPSEPGGRDVP